MRETAAAKNSCTDALKADAVRLYDDTEVTPFTSIGGDLGSSWPTLKNWVCAERKDQGVQPSRTAKASQLFAGQVTR